MFCNFRGLAKGEELAKINKTVAEMSKNFSLGAQEGDNKKYLEMFPVELIDEGVGLECMAEEEVRTKAPEEENSLGRHPVIVDVADLNRLWKKVKHVDSWCPHGGSTS